MPVFTLNWPPLQQGDGLRVPELHVPGAQQRDRQAARGAGAEPHLRRRRLGAADTGARSTRRVETVCACIRMHALIVYHGVCTILLYT